LFGSTEKVKVWIVGLNTLQSMQSNGWYMYTVSQKKLRKIVLS